jgi:hypothetical protein
MQTFDERRKFERFVFSKRDEIMASLLIPGVSEKPIAVQVLNIARGGIFFTIRSIRSVNLEIGQTIIFKDLYDDSNRSIALDMEAIIVWIMDDESNEYIGVGSKFTEPTEEWLQEKLDDYF